MSRRWTALGAALALGGVSGASTALAQPAAATPGLEYAFTATVQVGPPIEQGVAEGGRKRFIPITGGKVEGPRLSGEVLAGGGDWQVIEEGGLTRIEARYFVKAADGTVIDITNPGVRVASAEVIDRLAKGEEVAPDAYYFRTTPRFSVKAGGFDWLRRSVFVARGIRRPDRVLVDFYIVR